MGYSSRPYAKGFLSGSSFPTGVRWLVISNTAIWFIYFLATRFGIDQIFRHFPLVPSEVVTRFKLWELVSYMFLHDPNSLFHVLFNMLAIWMFGKDLEYVWGTRRFLNFYFTCGIGAGIIAIIGNYLIREQNSGIIGASGAIFGLLLAFGMTFPDAIIILFIFPIKAKYFVMIAGAGAIFGALMMQGGVSNSAHIGGLIVGYFALKSQQKKRPAKTGFSNPFQTMQQFYQNWKLQRAKRKFQVYLRKNGGQDPWVQ